MDMNWNVAALQMKVEIGNRQQNFLTVEAMIDEAVKKNNSLDVVVLPELFDVGFFPRPIQNFSDERGENAKKLFSRLAKKYSVNIVGGSVVNQIGEQVKNTAFIFDKNGNFVAEYSKTHLFSPAKEHKIFTAGDEVKTFELDGVKCGIIICYDVRFPELIRKLALQNISVLFVPTEWPLVRLKHWQILTKARAIENQIFLVGVNASGQFANGLPLAGHSVILNPWGEILNEADTLDPQIISAQLNLEKLDEIRATMHVFQDRREDLY